MCDGEAGGFSLGVTDRGPGLGAPAGVVADGVGGLAEGAALCAGDGAGLALPGLAPPGMALDETPATPAPSPRAEAWGRCTPPAVMSTVIPAAAATAANTATTATGRGCRRIRRHHRGPAGPIALGNPDGPNAPARCVTLTRFARPAGELSAQAVSTRPRSSTGSVTAGSSSRSAEPGTGAAALAGPPAPPGNPGPSRRRHSFRATACSQASSRSGSRSPSSRETAMRKVSSTTSAAAGLGSSQWP